ncbi:hypothetical protein HMPREF1575_01232 [Gardnerella vaginalis JCP7672]|nr:hypothetical protein HMPREF1575_01232 [Gardnerella vaginalis JCP7672]
MWLICASGYFVVFFIMHLCVNWVEFYVRCVTLFAQISRAIPRGY